MFTADGKPQIDRAQLLAKADVLDQQLVQIAAVRDSLRHVAQCPEPDHFQCPKFMSMLANANKRIRQ